MTIESLAHLSGPELLNVVARALAEDHEHRHPPRVALPPDYDPFGKTLNRVRKDTGLSQSAVRRIFKRLGLLGQIQPLNARKTHCKRGHEFTDDNTYREPRNGSIGRICRACTALRQRESEHMARDRARQAERRKDPDYRAKTRAYLKEYRKTYSRRPGVRERKLARQRLRRRTLALSEAERSKLRVATG